MADTFYVHNPVKYNSVFQQFKKEVWHRNLTRDNAVSNACAFSTFAAQYIGCERELDLNRDITNSNGSDIGLGHPVGSTGCRILVTLL